MRTFLKTTYPLHLSAALLLAACGGSSSKPSSTGPGAPSGGSESSAPHTSGGHSSSPDGESNEFQIKDSDTAGSAHGATPSKIKGNKTHAAMKFFVVDKGQDAPIPGIVISLESKTDGSKYYTDETDSAGYGEVLVPIGQSYNLVYLTLGQKDINAKVTVKDLPNQNIKLTLRYKRWIPKKIAVKLPPDAPQAPEEPVAPEEPAQPTFRIDGVTFASNSAKLSSDSHPRLDSVVEYLAHKKSARIEVSGHTDNVGKPAKNKKLSQQRADACKAYLVENGIDGSRIEAVGYGDSQPIASNKDEAGREQNRRIEAKEL